MMKCLLVIGFFFGTSIACGQNDRPEQESLKQLGPDACRTHDECAAGEHCIWWTAGCGPATEEGQDERNH